MRTTVSVDDHLLAAARRAARERGQTLGQLVEDALRRELATAARRDAPAVPVLHGAGGLRAGIDATSNRALLEALDEAQDLSDLR